MARAAAREGAAGVALVARSEGGLAAAAAEIAAGHPETRVSTHVADVCDRAAVDAAFAAAVAAHGAVDVVVNNAGIAGEKTPLGELATDALKAVFDVNVYGAHNVLRAALCAETIPSVIINMSSAAGVMGLPGLGAYCASKHALNGLSAVAGAELDAAGAAVRVVAISPGPVATDLNPTGARHVDDIAPFFAFLCDDSPAGSAARAAFNADHDVANGGYIHVATFEAWASSAAPS